MFRLLPTDAANSTVMVGTSLIEESALFALEETTDLIPGLTETTDTRWICPEMTLMQKHESFFGAEQRIGSDLGLEREYTLARVGLEDAVLDEASCAALGSKGTLNYYKAKLAQTHSP